MGVDKLRASVVEFKRRYTEMGEQAQALFRLCIELGAEVTRVNSDLPQGAAPLADLEAMARDVRAQPEELLSTTTIEAWAFERTGERLSPDQTSRVHNDGGGRGTLTPEGIMSKTGEPVVWRRFLVEQFHPASPMRMGPRLGKLEIPGFGALDPPFLTASDWLRPFGQMNVAERGALERPTLTRFRPAFDTAHAKVWP